MFKAYPIGRIFGVELRVHSSLLILLLLLGLFTLVSSGLLGLATTGLLVLALVVSVTLHELGHIFAARAFGIGTDGITLYPFGGLARLTREARSPTEEIVVALAGPAVNVLLAGLAAIPYVLIAPVAPLYTFILVNAALAIFNLVPAYPMDGGRVLRGALWSWLGHFDATWYAARAGQGFALLFGVVGIFMSPMLVVIAVFVFMQASGELARLKLSRWMRGMGQRPVGWHHPWIQQPPRNPEPPRPPQPPQHEQPGRFRRVEFVIRDGRLEPVDRSPW